MATSDDQSIQSERSEPEEFNYGAPIESIPGGFGPLEEKSRIRKALERLWNLARRTSDTESTTSF